MLEQIFSQLPQNCHPQSIDSAVSIYFSIDELKKTVHLGPEGCLVENGKTIESADCVCKTNSDFFLKVWNEGYKPGMKDFLAGTIKSNNPSILKTFLDACGKG